MTDIMSVETRSRVMSRIRGKHTGPEKLLAKLLRARAIPFRRHGKALPGKPDFYFPRSRVAVFVDGDFWHGWRFPAWSAKLKPFWRKKIAGNRMRDRRVHTSLRRLRWRVIRIWEHQLEEDPKGVIEKILRPLGDRLQNKPTTRRPTTG